MKAKANNSDEGHIKTLLLYRKPVKLCVTDPVKTATPQHLGRVFLESGVLSDEVDTPARAMNLRRAVRKVVLEGTKSGTLVGVFKRVGVLVDVCGAVDATGSGEGPVRHTEQRHTR